MPLIEGVISNVTIGGRARFYNIDGDAVINHFTETNELMKIHFNLPRARASHKNYEIRKKYGPCFSGTREALLREMMDWVTGQDDSKMYVLSGLAGIGKSTVAYTIAAQADELRLLGASFFFSRDEDDRSNAKTFFSTIAYQLCIHNEIFAKAIGDVLTECGLSVTAKGPQEQLQVLILNPLRCIVQSCDRPILIVVDALDECDEDDERTVVLGLSELVRQLRPFKVILTTRPRPLVNYLFANKDGHKMFHLQDIEDKVVDDDIRRYLSHNFSQEQVRARLLNPEEEWCASNQDVESLVKAAGRLFIIASTAVLYVLNKTLNDPGARMEKLLSEISQDRIPFHALNHFYSVIVGSAIHVDDDGDDILDRYQIVVGTIVVIQTPLPVATLACFIGEESRKIYAMLRNLQSVIILGDDDVPHIYHKSFTDYITDQERCKDPSLRIDPRIHHTQVAICCFEIMDQHLRYNILDLDDPARFMSNEDWLKGGGRIQEKFSQQLYYACIYWANHLEVANVENVDLMNGLKKFADEHMLYWFEVLSLIGKLDLAHRAIRVGLKVLVKFGFVRYIKQGTNDVKQKPTSSNLHRLLSDGLRFISKFYQVIKRSALHTYYSALPLIPTDSLLYRQYIKLAIHNVFAIDGGPAKWDALVANLSHGERVVNNVKFSLDSTLFVSCTEKSVDHGIHGMLKVWDAITGTPISTIPGHRFAVPNDFSTIVSSEDNTMAYYSVKWGTRGTVFTTSSKIQKLVISANNRVAAALSDGTVQIWDSRNIELICVFDGFENNAHRPRLQFSSAGTRLAYSSANGIVKLQDATTGRFVADLQCGSQHSFEFSGDGSRIASLTHDCGLTLWDCESGGVIGGIRDIGSIKLGTAVLAISANGSLLATAYHNDQVKLCGERHNNLAQVGILGESSPLMAFSQDNILAIATTLGIKLYNVNSCSLISTLSFYGPPTTLAFSPDYTHLAVGNVDGNVYLWLWDHLILIDTFSPSSKEASAVTALSLSRDCLRLACAFKDDILELWETSPTKRRITSHKTRTKLVLQLEFSPDGRTFASGSEDGSIKLWKGGNGSLRRIHKVASGLRAMTLSNNVLAAAWHGRFTLWTLDTLSLIHTFETQSNIQNLTISDDSKLAATIFDFHFIGLFDIVNHVTFTAFDLTPSIYTVAFLPDNSQLVAQSYTDAFLSLDLDNRRIIKRPKLEHLFQLPDIPFWRGVPICYCIGAENQHYIAGLFPHHENTVPVLWIPKDPLVMAWTQGSSMIALGCKDGRVMILRLPTCHVK